MTITLELTPEQEMRVANAKAQGIDVPRLMLNTLNYFSPEPDVPQEDKPGRVLQGHGKYAHLPSIVDAFEREKQDELDREERNRRVEAARGVLSHLPRILPVYLAEKQEEIDREYHQMGE